ncbi:XcyI family restriction endonuclease [Symbiobacterium thermophilum]|uniref:Restriction endonuclease R.SthI n=1 Tax=Symbiobacterium thermophilum (strain DSM 24528 / JCM 14929 / IAM 14863 / T) TaxID=292459 RepID=Q67SM5_SYMTH|nr:XcyI family restriction endonuclease [Symbiobacterium thermophilum]BAD39318.1 restriction endonuclease R.SthI [Symbiobacterium thermophilum IAM 14863]
MASARKPPKPLNLPSPLVLPDPAGAIEFGASLDALRQLFLVQALLATVKTLDLNVLNAELAQYVPAHRLQEMAGVGLRAEIVYPVPCLIEANPRLIAYYRLLLGYSAKRLYRMNSPLGPFETLEKKGVINPRLRPHIPTICSAMIASAEKLVDGLGIQRITRELLDDLQLLTLGSQLQGARNVAIGMAGMHAVRLIIEDIVAPYITKSDANSIVLTNSAGRTVTIRIGADPDVRIEEKVGRNVKRTLSIEVKAGEDNSNIYNRLGEAEKSHNKAKKKGFTEFWTIVNTSNIDLVKARVQTPTTNEFFLLRLLKDKSTPEYADFRQRIEALCGIPTT